MVIVQREIPSALWNDALTNRVPTEGGNMFFDLQSRKLFWVLVITNTAIFTLVASVAVHFIRKWW